jgi:hypothetical protein
MKKYILILVSCTLLGSATVLAQNNPPPLTCDHAVETERLARVEFEKLNKEFDSTVPFSPEREVAGGKVLGVLRLLDNVDVWIKSNCRTN